LAGNTRAIRCYEKAGFQKVRLLPRNELRDGEWRDAWLMSVRRET
jgi:aminoglycoside 6'-N-acetyltransferase